eukprot:5112719-Pyramimonas_sp.AAC.1
MEPDEGDGTHIPVMVALESTKIAWCVKTTAITSAPFCVHPSLVYRKPVTPRKFPPRDRIVNGNPQVTPKLILGESPS